LARVQTIQILLTRFQMQQTTVAWASEHLNDARSKLSEIQVHDKDMAAEIKRFEDAQAAQDNPQAQKRVQDRSKAFKDELEVSQNSEQQRQAAEMQAEQHLRAEQDKLDALEAQRDELTRTGASPQPSRP
jgi:hypothetical protein